MLGNDHDVRLDACAKPEFDSWRWVDFWYPLEHVVNFKREVYWNALLHLAPAADAVAASDDIFHRRPEPPPTMVAGSSIGPRQTARTDWCFKHMPLAFTLV